MRADCVVDLFADNGAFHVVDAERQRRLRQERRDHDPVGLDVVDVIEVQPTHREIAEIVESRRRAAPTAELDTEPEKLTRFFRRIERFGRVAPVAPNRFFLPETLRELAALAASLADESPAGSFTAAAFKDRSGIGRNLTIEVLEYLDRIGATRRDGDARVVLRSAAELFG